MMRRLASGLVSSGLLAACGRGSPPPPPQQATRVSPAQLGDTATVSPTVAPLVEPCIVPDSWPELDSVSITDTTVELCAEDVVGHDPRQPRVCFHVDLESGAYSAAPLLARPVHHEPERVSGAWAFIDDDGVHICSRGAPCRTVRPPDLAADNGWGVAVSADGWRFIPCHSGGCSPLEIRDGATGKLIRSVAPWNTGMGSPSNFQMGFFVGDSVLALASDTPVTSEGRLFDARGKLVLKLGQLAEHTPHPLGDGRWAIETWEATKLLVLDPMRTKIVATYPLRAPVIPESVDASNALVAAAVGRKGGGITAVLAHGAVGQIALFEADPKKPARVLHPPMCEASAVGADGVHTK